MSTPNMGLTQSTPLVTVGPVWAEGIETNVVLIDQHDHTTGKGTPIPTAGFNINADLSFGSYSATNLLSTQYTSQDASTADVSAVYVVEGDLYYNNGAGIPIQLTSGTAINVAGVGGITGLAGTTGALTYSDITKTFSFTQDANKTANGVFGTVYISEPGVAAASLIALKSPVSLAGAYDITLPATLPGSSKYVTISASGVLTATDSVDNSTLEVSAGSIRIKDLGVTTAKLAANAVTDAKIRQGTACTVIGRSANSTGDVADIALGTNGFILQRLSNTVTSALLTNTNIADNTISPTKLTIGTTATGSVQSGTRSASSDPGSDDASVTYTSTGTNKNLMIKLVGEGFGIKDNGGGGSFQRTAILAFYIDGVQAAISVMKTFLADASAETLWPASAMFSVVTAPAAGSRTVGVRFWSGGTTNTLAAWENVAVQVVEI